MAIIYVCVLLFANTSGMNTQITTLRLLTEYIFLRLLSLLYTMQSPGHLKFCYLIQYFNACSGYNIVIVLWPSIISEKLYEPLSQLVRGQVFQWRT